MIGFGVFGYFMKVYGYQVSPLILGIILARLIDDNWRRAIISEREDLGALAVGIATSPLSLTLFLIITLALLSQTPLWPKRGRSGAVTPNRELGTGP
jgi:putative tricarboxylic transport membrane protein